MIEDWSWAHEKPVADMWSQQIPLTRLILELVLPVPVVPGLIAEITIDAEAVRVRRGDAEVDPRGFDVFDCSDRAGRGLLATDERLAPDGATIPAAD